MAKLTVGVNDLKTWCEQNGRMELLLEWDYTKNSPKTPSDYTSSSQQKVWWKCSKGHSWEAIIGNRHKGSHCPYCTNAKVLVGYNDLATTNPNLVSEWNYEKNAGLKDQRGRDISIPENILASSSQNVWWICSKGHEWKSSVYQRSNNGMGCPFCSNKSICVGFNDLSTTNPELAKEWNYDKNHGLKNKQGRDISTPDKVTAGSHNKVWWICSKGHEYAAVIEGRSRGGGCPICNKKRIDPRFLMITKELLAEWDYENNKKLDPDNLPKGFNKVVWWKCPKGHSYKANISSKNRGKQCPFCLDEEKEVDLLELSADLFAEWDFEKNGSLDPHKLKAFSLLKAWWKCKFGHSWNARIYNRLRGAGCPYCKSSGSSMPEQGLAFYLSKVCQIEQRKKVNKREIDIFLPEYNVGIEYDGMFFHENNEKILSDKEKDKTAIKSGVYLFRIKESDRNEIVNDTIINFKTDNMGKNYEWALNQLCQLLYVLTMNDGFLNLDINAKRDRLKIREQFNLSIKDNSLAEKYPLIAAEWNYEKNGILLPDMFSYGAQEKVWWKCSAGHEYQAVIGSRTNMRSGCPFCAGRALLTGFNDLATLKPELAVEWDYQKNQGLKNRKGIDVSTPDRVKAYSKQKVWWVCSKGHSWNTDISNRSHGSGCPYCANKKIWKSNNSNKVRIQHQIELGNSLENTNPELAKEWNYEKNKTLTPSDVTKMSGQKVWWKCLKGHEWEASINNRSRGNKCPFCTGKSVLTGFNDLATLNPNLASEWNYERNKGLVDKRGRDVSVPEKVTVNSQQKVWWKCSEGHEWLSTVANRNLGNGCKQCYRLKKGRKVLNVDTGIVYSNMNEAVNATGAQKPGIINCCKGKAKSAGGYHWKYAD